MGAHLPGSADLPDRQGGVRVVKAIHPSLKDSAADYLREQILTGQLTPGTKIDQDEISAALGISRLPVREALIELANEGLVDAVPRHRRVRRGRSSGPTSSTTTASSDWWRGWRRAGRRRRSPMPTSSSSRAIHESFTARDRRRHPGELEPRVPPAHQPRRRLPPAGVGARAAVAQPAGALLRVRARMGRDIGPPPRGSSLRSSSATRDEAQRLMEHHVTESGELAVGILQEMGYWDAIPADRASTSGAA